jgi:hypothetical protein
VQDVFIKKKRAMNTNINFVQTKSGLMREENEGFGKLIVELCEASRKEMVDEHTEQRIKNIISLIGRITAHLIFRLLRFGP